MTITTMAFRAPKHRAVIVALVVISFLTLLFVLGETQSGLGKAEEEAARCQQKHDSVSAQLVVLYEHKTRLEKNLQAEIERKKAVDEELKTLQQALSRDVATQKEKVAKLLRQYEELKEQQKDEFNKLKATYESLRTEKEKLDGEVEDLNLQNQKLKESNQKLEEEIRKMQQIAPVDISEVARLRERVKACDAAGIPEAAASRVITGDGSNRVAGASVDVGKVDKPETIATTKTTTTKDDPAAEQDLKDAMAVLPAPQQPAKGPSSTEKPAGEAPRKMETDHLSDELNLRPVAEQDEQKPSFFGHRFGDNVDRNQQPFHHDKPPPVPEDPGDRDYPDNNPDAMKDDDGGADEGEDAVDRKEKKAGLQEDFDDVNNNNNNNNNIINNNDGERLKLLPK